MTSSFISSLQSPKTYQHLYGFSGSTTSPTRYHHYSEGRSSSFSPTRSSQVSNLTPATVHGRYPKQAKDGHRSANTKGRGEGAPPRERTRPRSHTTGAVGTTPPLSRRQGYLSRPRRLSSSEWSPFSAVGRSGALPAYATTQRPGRLMANNAMRAAIGGDDGNTFVADVHPTFCVDGSIRYIEPIDEHTGWTAELDGSIRIRALPQGSERQTLEGRENTFCTCLLYLPEYKCVWVAFNDGFMRVYDVATAALQKEFVQHADGVNCMIELEGSVYTGGVDWKIYLWNPETITYERLFFGHAGGVRCFCPFAGSSGSILFSGSDDGTIKAWDPYAPLQTEEDRACLHTFKGHDRGVLCMEAIGPLSQLWSGGEDGTVRVWDLKTLECMSVLQAHASPVASLLLVESRMWSGDKYGYIILWDVLLQSPLQEITSRLPGAKLGMVLTMKKIQPTTCWKVWTAGMTGFVQTWNAEAVPIVFDQKYAYKYGQRGLHDLVVELENFVQLLEDELATCKEDASRQYERGRMEIQHALAYRQLLEEENEDLRRRLRDKGVILDEGSKEEKRDNSGSEEGLRHVKDRNVNHRPYMDEVEEKEREERHRRRVRELQEKIKQLEEDVDRLERQRAAAAASHPPVVATPSFLSLSSVAQQGGPSTPATEPSLLATTSAALIPPAEAYTGSVACTSHRVLVPGGYWESLLSSRPYQVREWAKEDICMAIGIPTSQLHHITFGTIQPVRAAEEEQNAYRRGEKEFDSPWCFRYQGYHRPPRNADARTGMNGARRRSLSFLDFETSSPTVTGTSGRGRQGSPNFSPHHSHESTSSSSESFRFSEDNSPSAMAADSLPPTKILPLGTFASDQEENVMKVGAGLCLEFDIVHSADFPISEVQRRLDVFAFPRLSRLHERLKQYMEASEEEQRKLSKLVEKVGLDAAEEYISGLERRLAIAQASSMRVPSYRNVEEHEEVVNMNERHEKEVRKTEWEEKQERDETEWEEGEKSEVRKAHWEERERKEEKEEEEEEEVEDDEEEEGEEEDEDTMEGTGKKNVLKDLRQELDSANDMIAYYKDVITEKEKQRGALVEQVDQLRGQLAAATLFDTTTAGLLPRGEEGLPYGKEKEGNGQMDVQEAIRVIAHLQSLLAASKKKAQLVQEEFQHFFVQLISSPTNSPRVPASARTTHGTQGEGLSSSLGGGLSSSYPLLHTSEGEETQLEGMEEPISMNERGKEQAMPSSFFFTSSSRIPRGVPQPAPFSHSNSFPAGQPTTTSAGKLTSQGSPTPLLSVSMAHPSDGGMRPPHSPASSSFQRLQGQAPLPPYPSYSLSSSSSSSSWSSDEAPAKESVNPSVPSYNVHHLPPPLQAYGNENAKFLSSIGKGGGSSRVGDGRQGNAKEWRSSQDAPRRPAPLCADMIKRDTLVRPPYPAWARTLGKEDDGVVEAGSGRREKARAAREAARRNITSSLSDEDDKDDEEEEDVRALYAKQFQVGNATSSTTTAPAMSASRLLPHTSTNKQQHALWAGAPPQPGGKAAYTPPPIPPAEAGSTLHASSMLHPLHWNPAKNSPPNGGGERRGEAGKTFVEGRRTSSSVPISPSPRASHGVQPATRNPYIGISAEELMALPLPSEMVYGGKKRRPSRHSTEELSTMNAALLTRVADVEAVMTVLSEQHEKSMSRRESIVQRK